VGSGFAVFTGKVLAEQLKFKLNDRCSNNQAEQLAIVKALEVLEMQQVKNTDTALNDGCVRRGVGLGDGLYMIYTKWYQKI
jgi:ribonuclease HI